MAGERFGAAPDSEEDQVNVEELRETLSAKARASKSAKSAKGAKSPAPLAKRLYPLFLLFGVGALLPFNCVITPIDYWSRFYPSVFLSWASFIYNAGNWCTTILMLFVGYKWNANAKVFGTLGVWMTCTVLLPVFTRLIPGETLMTVLSLVLVCLMGIANGFFFPTVVAISGEIDGLLVQAVMAGNGIAGIVTDLLKIACKGLTQAFSQTVEGTDDELYYSTLAYFIIAALVLAGCLAGWIYINKRFKSVVNRGGKTNREKALASNVQNEDEADDFVASPGEAGHSGSDSERHDEQRDQSGRKGNEETAILASSSGPTAGAPMKFWKLAGSIWMPGLTVFLVFFVTLGVFPAITARVPCIYNIKHYGVGYLGNSWWDIIYLSVFMFGDWWGRSMPQYKACRHLNLAALFSLAIARFVFIALFIIMILPTPEVLEDESIRLPYLSNDLVSILIMLAFAYTNGHISSLVMMRYLEKVRPIDAPLAGNIMTFCLNTGLFLGGVVSMGITEALNTYL